MMTDAVDNDGDDDDGYPDADPALVHRDMDGAANDDDDGLEYHEPSEEQEDAEEQGEYEGIDEEDDSLEAAAGVLSTTAQKSNQMLKVHGFGADKGQPAPATTLSGPCHNEGPLH